MWSNTRLREGVWVSREHAPFRDLLWIADESLLACEEVSLPLVQGAPASLEPLPETIAKRHSPF
jgi:hypothetical protein